MKPSLFYFDDEETLLDLFAQMFNLDYNVRTASTLSDARRIISECPDVIISDWNMPEISGVRFLREAQLTCPRSFRIILTGFAHPGDMISEISSGLVQLFITKPWTETEMREALERAITDKRGSRLKP